MKGFFRYLWIFLNYIRCLPHLFLFYFHGRRKVLQADARRWLEILDTIPARMVYKSLPTGFIYLLTFYKEYRNLFYWRIGFTGYLLDIICRRRPNLIINAGHIEPGFFIRHGLGTSVGAKYIGRNCQVNQNVTITAGVTLEDEVRVLSGAVIHGRITIGRHTTVGANVTVMQNIPPNSTVLPEKPRVIKWKRSEN